ncbi:uncharacterized protein TRIADDRAFT_32834 [Trichoplax adhaerens]|uniref:Fatty acyl-CoA reductase n=1 Tax=Trichoplax adhaerens TaxID=10228 RepID=B3SBL3_TRIAD|nr:hypothetical protein TRIADDRAFT_32834 [Trichoplax adhaerens]EDV19879.1 hypothetical protein TRIADDRAFT_32834 [Trichoplax adhaerens]|eukprot:XP_002117621.1 hypothetical protein TRIADDRAFT_32834 [Trichoplax adhaerens]
MPPSIKHLYAGQTIFITGVSGFLGKALLEKLLRVAPNIERIYVLLRPKKGQQPTERLKTILQTKLFDSIREASPNFTEKVIPIFGDITLENYGICESDLCDIIANTDIVFHVAATIKFDELLRKSILQNVVSVQTMIRICKRMPKLKSYVHVSTAFCNTDKEVIEEVIYSDIVPPQKLIDAMSWMDDDMISQVTPKLLGRLPNTYTFTKKLAEIVIATEGLNLPIAIVRPSIIGASWKEPVSGWIDNYYGGTAAMVLVAKGLLRRIVAKEKCKADLVPVDYTVNMLIAACWHAVHASKQQTPLIYNCCSSPDNPFVWGSWLSLTLKNSYEFPHDQVFRMPSCSMNGETNRFHLFMQHWVPAYIVDAWRFVCGKKPRLINEYDRIHRSMTAFEYFTCTEFKWTNKNAKKLWQTMTPEDHKEFPFDFTELNWESYISNYCIGIKRYLMNEDLSNLPQAKKKMARRQHIRWGTYALLVFIIWRVIFSKSMWDKSLWLSRINTYLKTTRTLLLISP